MAYPAPATSRTCRSSASRSTIVLSVKRTSFSSRVLRLDEIERHNRRPFFHGDVAALVGGLRQLFEHSFRLQQEAHLVHVGLAELKTLQSQPIVFRRAVLKCFQLGQTYVNQM